MFSFSKKIITFILIISLLALSVPRSARADYWGSNNGSAILKQTLEEMYLQIKESIIASLKMAAIRIVMSRMESLLGMGGMSGGPIGNWHDFIYGSANKYSSATSKSFFSNLKNGTPSDVKKRVITPAENAANADFYKKPDIQNYVSEGKVGNVFSSTSNPWKVWEVAGQSQNSPAYAFLRNVFLQDEAFRQKEEEKKAEGIAGQGYKGTKKEQTREATTSTGKKVTVPAGF